VLATTTKTLTAAAAAAGSAAALAVAAGVRLAGVESNGMPQSHAKHMFCVVVFV